MLSEVAGIMYGLGEPVANCLLLGFGYLGDEIGIIQEYLEWRKSGKASFWITNQSLFRP